ncbi:MAG TPA: hypothetical protein VF306_12190, partial [Pirellulales bacterium]
MAQIDGIARILASGSLAIQNLRERTFRSHMAAAPLKPEILELPEGVADAFRSHMAAAPLKQAIRRLLRFGQK